MSDLKELKTRAELLITDLETYLSEAESVAESEKKLERYSLTLSQAKKENEAFRDGLVKKEKELNQQKEYQDSQFSAIEKQREIINKTADRTREITLKEEKLADKEREMDIKEKQLDLRLSEFKVLEEKTVEISHEQAMIEKEKAVDRQRKEKLDFRETKIKQRERQLQIEDDAI